jgi:CRP/FNR family cyclic AMP-dependent transcriptional regulator
MTAAPAFLSRLGEAELAALSGRWAAHDYRHGELIIAHGDSGRDVFFLLEGRARVTLFSEDGREIAYRDLAPGDIFGELACIDGKARSASIVALETARAARLRASAFRELVQTHPQLAWSLLEHLSALLRRMTDRVYEYSTLVVRERLILELVRRADEAGPPVGISGTGGTGATDGQVCLDPAPTHFELAAAISTHREAVSREMSTLAKRGLIAKRGNRLVLSDLAALQALVGVED